MKRMRVRSTHDGPSCCQRVGEHGGKRTEQHGLGLLILCSILFLLLGVVLLFVVFGAVGAVSTCQVQGWFGGSGCSVPPPPPDLYTPAVLVDLPSLFFKLNETTGNVSYNYGTVVTAVGNYTGPEIGELPTLDTAVGGTSAEWTGHYESVQLSGVPFNVSQIVNASSTTEVWFRSTSNGVLLTVLGLTNVTTGGHSYQPQPLVLWINVLGSVCAAIDAVLPPSPLTVCTPLAYNDGLNHYAVFEYAPTTVAPLTLLIDGMSVADVTTTVPTWAYTDVGVMLQIGMAPNLNGLGGTFSQTYTGFISNVAFYQNAVLAEARVTEHYEAGGGVPSIVDALAGLTPAEADYAQTVVDDGATFCWPLAYTATSVVTDVVGAYLGVFNQSAANFTLNGGSGGITFLANLTSVYTATAAWQLGTGPFAAEFWVKLNASGATAQLSLAPFLAVQVLPSGAAALVINATLNSTTVAALLSPGGWHQVVVTSGAGLWLWVDGLLQTGLAASQLPVFSANPARWVLTAAPGTAVKRVSVYPTALSRAQIYEHWVVS